MSPFETQILVTAWPWIWSGILGAGAWWLREQNARLSSICRALDEFREDIDRIEKEMADDRLTNRHHLDRLLGATLARFTGIEAVCQAQHGVTFARRSTDRGLDDSWAQDSDILSGSGAKKSAKSQ